MTAISSLTKEFAILPPHWDFIYSTEEGMEEKVDQLLNNNPVRESDVSDSTFLVLKFLFASICYRYDNLDRNLHKKWAEGISNLHCCSASRRISKIRSRIIPMDKY